MNEACVMDFCELRKLEEATDCSDANPCVNLQKLPLEGAGDGAELLFQVAFRSWMARRIEKQTRIFIGENITEKDSAAWESSVGQSEVLNNARKNFGKNPYSEIFSQLFWGFNQHSSLMQHFCRSVANAGALDDVYNALGHFYLGGQRIWPASAKPDSWSNFYMNGPLERGVRDRYRLVREAYIQSGGGKTLSVACGSAQPLIDAAQVLVSKGQGDEIELLLTDSDQESLKLALMRAEQAQISDKVTTDVVSIMQLAKHLKQRKFKVIEACGIFDYFNDDGVVKLLRRCIMPLLESNGTLIVSGMNENKYATILRSMYNWEVIYRPAATFGELIRQAGFVNTKVLSEPQGTYYVATATAR